ncbi:MULTISPECIES: hypothetical protein [Pedobacter]|nr:MULTISPECIES: hypothetical protein [Pedobacter]MDO7744854.1 hypothetical protein [Pedobacter sp.]AZI24127.1 hypothetical protein EA772_01745 [Pedobacter sp. G11]MCX2479398.1 hypothetical protein [Pedobacter sp. MC2016-15]MCX2584759.1 hypothetical protein [Pedobacter sp. MR22-3]MCZ4224775.1 hypothetical protein [Pedobacter sp. SJ11]
MKKLKINSQLLLLAAILIALVLLCLSAKVRSVLAMVLPVETEWFLWINQHHNAFWDTIMYWASDKRFWLPFYAFIIYCLFQNFCKKIWQVLITIALLVASADQIASGLIKNTVKRLRPSHEPNLTTIIHLSKAGAGGMYGWPSALSSPIFKSILSAGSAFTGSLPEQRFLYSFTLELFNNGKLT